MNVTEKRLLVIGVMVLIVAVNLERTDAFPHQQLENEKPGYIHIRPRKFDNIVSRQGPSADIFPDALDIELSAEEVPVKMHHLKRNYEVSDNVPVLLLRDGKVKKYRFESKVKVAYYFNKVSGASFMAWPKTVMNETAAELEIYGTLMSDNEEFLVQPPQNDRSSYTLSKITETEPTLSDYVLISDTDAEVIQRKFKKHRMMKSLKDRDKRQATVYEIEIFFVMDYAMYEIWYATTEGQTNRLSATVEYMKQFTAFLLNSINVRYQSVTDYGYTINCLFAGIYIADMQAAAPFVEDHVYDFGFVSETVLSAFRDWGETHLVDVKYDDAMLFTGYNMGSNKTGVFNNATAGMAFYPSYYTNGNLYKAAVCGSNGYSINEAFNFGPTIAQTGAHEIGHNLGSQHDGSPNTCGGGGYIMEPSKGVTKDPEENQRLWIFSSCSQDYFDIYINDLITLSNTGGPPNCLTSRSATNADDLDPYVDDLAGQIYGPDVQCERMRGLGSYMYRGYFIGNYSGICALMPCSVTTNEAAYYFHIPWEGTTCANRKICQSGFCVESSSAPGVKNEACPFGDVPYNFPGHKNTCKEFVGSVDTSYRCYQEYYRKSCCSTCEEIKQNSTDYTDCEYGDKASWCDSWTENIRKCRVNRTRSLCCKSCVDKALDIPGCPYGDYYSGCQLAHCSTYPDKCCQTCAQTTTTGMLPVTNNTISTSTSTSTIMSKRQSTKTTSMTSTQAPSTPSTSPQALSTPTTSPQAPSTPTASPQAPFTTTTPMRKSSFTTSMPSSSRFTNSTKTFPTTTYKTSSTANAIPKSIAVNSFVIFIYLLY